MTPRTVAHHAPLSMGFSRQGYWSGLPFPPLEDLPNLGIKPASPVSPALRWIPYHWAIGESPKIVLKNNKWLSSQITSDQSNRSWLKTFIIFWKFLFQRNKNICLYKNLYMNFQSSFICKIQKMEITIETSFSMWISKQKVTYSYHEILLSYKENHYSPTQLGWIPKALYWMRKTNPKQLPTVWFPLCNILEMTKL